MMQEMSGNIGGIGSSSVGSRLAGEDPGLHPQHQSPIYHPSAIRNFTSTSYVNGSSEPTVTGNVNMQAVTQAAVEKAESIKSWGMKTFRCTKQILSEHLGRGTRTVDIELDAKVAILRDTKRKYENIVAVSQALSTHIASMIQAQRVLADAFTELSQKSNELQEEFQCNSDTQHILIKNGESLLSAIKFFINGLSTLCKKTMEDTLLTVAKYEQARVEYDAYRTQLETLMLASRSASTVSKQRVAEVNFNRQKEVYEKLRQDVGVKMQFLDENKVKVMQRHLLLFHNAITAFFAGNQQMLEVTLKQFNIAPKVPGQEMESFLEKE